MFRDATFRSSMLSRLLESYRNETFSNNPSQKDKQLG
jgi:hypothetical protein